MTQKSDDNGRPLKGLSIIKELKKKIKINMREYNNGKYANRKQAIAVAYSQIKKKYPQCNGKI